MPAKRYTVGLFLLIALALAAVAAFNRVIDPFWYYRDIEIKGLNAIKPRFARFERHVKPALLARERPEAIVIGSSFAEIGFDPLDPAFTDNGRLRGYNYAFAGGSWEVGRCAFQHAVKHAPVKRIVMGIHAGALPEVDCTKVWQGMSVSTVELLLSVKTLNNAIRTVVEQHKGRPSHTREGRYLYARDVPGAALRFREYFQRHTSWRAQCLTPVPAKADARLGAAVPKLDLSGLRAVIREARQHGTEIAWVIYPQHVMWQELEFACGDPQARWRNMAAIAQVVAEEALAGQTQTPGHATLWVFDGYDALRGERVFGREPTYWQDPEHFNFELGARMLATIYGREQDFGTRVTPENIAGIYARLVAQREQFLATADWLYTDLRALAAPMPAVR